MKILAMDTSSFPASVSVAEDGVILGEYVLRDRRKHSQNIMVMTERLMSDLGMDVADMDLFAVTTGPGSFTGLRIGISTIRTLAQAVAKPVAAVNTLEALAYNLSEFDEIVVPMLDARRDEVFCGAYRFCDGIICEVTKPCVMSVSAICEEFKDEKVIFTGDGVLIHGDELRKYDNFSIAPLNMRETRSSSLICAALCKEKNNELKQYNEVLPVYLRKSQAEQEYERRMANDSNRQ